MEFKGIDVSKHQGNINWNQVKQFGVQFAILRAGYGREISQKDPKFESNYQSCQLVGMPVGAYWFSYATDVSGAKLEAKACLEAIKDKKFQYPVWFDQEWNGKTEYTSNEVRTEMVKAFCEELEKAGYYTGLYCSRSWLQSMVNYKELNQYDIWVAAYGSDPGKVPLPYGMWQYSSTGKTSGISGDVDQDIAYKNYPNIMTKNHLNGF